MAKSIISVKNLYKSYHSGKEKVEVLKNVDLEILSGEIVAVMGRSGSGKTTLLNSISALDEIDSGEVIIDGQNVHKLSDNKRSKYRAKNIGFIFQAYNLIPVLTASENVEIPLLASGSRSKIARELSKTALEKVGLEDKLNRKPAELSGGQQQRVAVARAMAGKPKVIFGDEPTGNLDSKTEDHVLELIQNMNKEGGLTFVLVTHSERVASICHRIIRIEDGKII